MLGLFPSVPDSTVPQHPSSRPSRGRLTYYAVDTRTLIIQDGSGLSHENVISAEAIASFMIGVAKKSNGLDLVLAGLPVSGKTGSLANRFVGDNLEAVGHVYAKTGWISNAHTLAGVVEARDGSRLAFAFYGVGQGIPGRPAPPSTPWPPQFTTAATTSRTSRTSTS